MKTRELAYTGILAALIAVCSWISIPTAVPFTLQTFAVFLTLGLLGGRLGTLAVTVYLLLGAVGLPVFAGFHGGLGAFLGATGGYLVGFLFTDSPCGAPSDGWENPPPSFSVPPSWVRSCATCSAPSGTTRYTPAPPGR